MSNVRREKLKGHLFEGGLMKVPNAPGVERWRAALEVMDEDLTGLEQGRGAMLALGTRIDRHDKAFYLHEFVSKFYGWASMIGVRRLHRGGSEPFNVTFMKVLGEMVGCREALARHLGDEHVASWLGAPHLRGPELLDGLLVQIESDRQSLESSCKPVSDFADGIAHVIPLNDGMGKTKYRQITRSLDELRRLCNSYGRLVGAHVFQFDDRLQTFVDEVEYEFDVIFGHVVHADYS